MNTPKACLTYSDFTSGNNVIPLPDVIKINVTEELNGMFDLEMEYPENGENADMLNTAGANAPDATIIIAEPRPNENQEPFFIYDIERSIDRIARIKAHHWVYTLAGFAKAPFSTTGISATVAALSATGFNFINNGITDTTTVFATEVPKTLWELVGEIAAAFGAEMSYAYNYNTSKIDVTFNAQRGAVNNDVTVAEGVNIIDYTEKTNCDGRIINVCGYAKGDDGNGNITTVQATRTTHIFGQGIIQVKDFTDEFTGLPTFAQLDLAVQIYANSLAGKHMLGQIYELQVDFVPLGITTDYPGEPVEMDIGDTLTVHVLDKYVQQRVVKIVYNPFTEKYELVSVGSKPVNVADTIAQLERNQMEIYRGGVS